MRGKELLTSEPLQCPHAEGAIATPYAFDRQARRVSGCLYTRDGQKITLSERHGGTGGKKVDTFNPDSIVPDSRAALIPGHSVYLGHLMGRHYGHFLLESLSATWALEEIGEVDRVVFHPFLFGAAISGFARHLLSAAGVNPERIEIIAKPCRFERIHIPQRLFKINHSAHVRLRSIYARIRAKFESHASGARIYVSRCRLPSSKRRIVNEQVVEGAFRRRGFTVVYPEVLALPDQVALYASCSVLAGVAGSALHNIVFCRPGTKLVHVCDPRTPSIASRTQVTCNALAQAELHVVRFKADGAPNAISAGAVEESLSRVL